MSNRNIIDFKRDLRNTIIKIYRTKGYEYTERSINNLIKKSNLKTKDIGKKEWAVQVRGECCELMLELQLWEFIKTHQVPWICSKGLCIERTDNKQAKTTELDLTLFTPGKIILFESKYRQGKIQLIDECTIVPDWGSVMNVYKQNIMHLTNLKYYLNSAVITLQGVKPFAITLYMEDLSRVTDRRTKDNKQLVPLLGPANVNKYLKTLVRPSKPVWNMKELDKIVKELDLKSEENFKRHMKNINKKK